MILPVGVIGAAREVQERLSRAGFRFCFIGGVALQRWGEPRFTQDVADEWNLCQGVSCACCCSQDG